MNSQKTNATALDLPSDASKFDANSITISFPKPIESLTLNISEREILTCEALIWLCLQHAMDHLRPASENWDIVDSLYVPAFGLRTISEEGDTIFLPLHYEFRTDKHPKECHFRVRHRPPPPPPSPPPPLPSNGKEIILGNIVWELLILQAVEDFMSGCVDVVTKDPNSSLTKTKILDFCTLALIISSSSHDNDQEINVQFNVKGFTFLKYKRIFSGEIMCQLMNSLICSPNWIFDHIFYYFRFKKWISHFKKRNYFLGTLKKVFIYNLMYRNRPFYCVESFEAKTVLDDSKLEDCCVQIRTNKHGGFDQLDLYLKPNGVSKCSLDKIDEVLVKGRDSRGNEVVILTKCRIQSFSLIFKNAEIRDSFLSLLQGHILLSVQPDFNLTLELKPQSLKLRESLQSFGRLRHEDACKILINMCTMTSEKSFLLYQDKSELYTFTVAQYKGCKLKWSVQWSWEDKFTIFKEDKPTISCCQARIVLKILRDNFGVQLHPRKVHRKQPIDESSIYKLVFQQSDETETSSFNRIREAKNNPILEKDLLPGFRKEISDENGDLKRFQVQVRGEDRLLVELQQKATDSKAMTAMLKNTRTMSRLTQVAPKRMLQFYGEAYLDSSRMAYLYEFPTHFPLNQFLALIQASGKVHLCSKLKICLQVLDVLRAIEELNAVDNASSHSEPSGVFHGNIRTSNFYVFENGTQETFVKLGDPGLVHMYDDPQCDFQYLNERSPWLAPERRHNPKWITVETECYAVGTTLCEILHATDDFKTLLKLDCDVLLQYFKDGKEIPAPCLSSRDDDPNAVTPDARDLMALAWQNVQKCWSQQPSERPAARDLTMEFRRLAESAEEFPENVMDFLRCIVPDPSGSLINTCVTPKDIQELMANQQKHYIPPSQIEVLNDSPLGKGYFGFVHKCRIWKKRIINNREEIEEYPQVAAKTLKRSPKADKDLVTEIATIASLDNENIVKFLFFSVDETKIILLMEYLDGGSLLSQLLVIGRKFQTGLSVEQIHYYYKMLLKLSHDVAKGMEYLHGRKIIHCDLAARNVLLCVDTLHPATGFVAKVGDFGLSKLLKVDQTYYRKEDTTIPWMWSPPEYLTTSKIKVRYEGDVWSFGIVLWEVFTLGTKVEDKFLSRSEAPKQLKKGWRLEKKYLQFDDRVYTDIMESCWEYDFADRPSFTQLKENIATLKSSVEM